MTGLHSIRGRLFVMLTLVTVLVWCAMAAQFYWQARSEMTRVLDGRLVDVAHVAAALVVNRVRTEPGAITSTITSKGRVLTRLGGVLAHRYGGSMSVQVWRADGMLLLRSADAPRERLAVGTGLSVTHVDQRAWRVYSLPRPAYRVVVQVAAPEAVRGALTRDFALRLVAPLLMLLPVLAGLIWWSVSGGLQPLARLSRAVLARSGDYLSPIEMRPIPREVRPVVAALNRLFERVQSAMDRERRFTADAAHELRTPLAGLKAQVESALDATDPEERSEALRRLRTGVDRTSRLVDQLLTLARLDDAGDDGRREQVMLDHLCREVIADLAPGAVERDVDIALEPAETPAIVEGDPVLIEVLIRNLLDNAVRYADDGGQVQVRLMTTGTGVELQVLDNGPGIAQADQAQLFKRFRRGTNIRAPGSGLGLSIVSRVAERHGATVVLEPREGGGTRARVEFS